MGKFIVIVLDSFGVGFMEDVPRVRPQDTGANTALHIFEKVKGLKLSGLEKLGLMNTLDYETDIMKKNPQAVWGRSALMHFNADTFYGHQEIMGTKPRHPVMEPFSKSIEAVSNKLIQKGHSVSFIGKGNLRVLLVDGCVTVGDNLEADGGQAYNVTATFDKIPFEKEAEIARIVRDEVHVSRVIVFGGRNVPVEKIIGAYEIKDGIYAGINAPGSGVYDEGYFVQHLGYGIDSRVQIPSLLGKKGIKTILIGKVADIVENPYGESIPGVDTAYVMEKTIEKAMEMETGFICTNVQETDLAGHKEDSFLYADRLSVADVYISRLMPMLNPQDIMIIMADHGNDPTIGHSHHTRENVPILIYKEGVQNIFIGERKTLSDIGATVAEYFNAEKPENGESFLKLISKKEEC